MTSIRRMAMAARTTIDAAHTIGVTTPTSAPPASPMVQARIEVGVQQARGSAASCNGQTLIPVSSPSELSAAR